MNTRKIAAEFRLSYWAQILNERQESRLSVKAFCKNAGFHENIYYYWQRKLREATCEEISRIKQEEASRLVPLKFVEVKAEEKPASPIPVSQQAQIRIDIGEMRITAESEYPIGKLAELLREVTRSC